MKKIKQFYHGYYSSGGDIEIQFNEWVMQNPELNIIQVTASESSDAHGHYKRSLYALYEEKTIQLS